MTFKSMLQEKLKDKLTEDELAILPSGFQAIGKIAILNLKEKLRRHKKEIGKAVLDTMPRFTSIWNKKGEIEGEFRKPQIEFLAGEKNTEAITKENNCLYRFDVTKLMFAKGNLNERVRLPKLVKSGEVIVDMFAGIGYFSIPILKFAKPKKIYAIELNPTSFHYLEENIKLNKVQEKIEIINGDCRKEVEKLAKKGIKADRIIMGYFPPPKDYLPYAMKIAKKGTVIHYATLIYDEKFEEEKNRDLKYIEDAAKEAGFKAKLLNTSYVKSYRPKVGHYVLDLEVI